MNIARHVNQVKPLSPTEAAAAAANYFRSLGLHVSPGDEAEILARILGHKDNFAYQAYLRNAKKFYAFRAALEDYVEGEEPTFGATLATPILAEGDLDEVRTFAEQESSASDSVILVFDGNGILALTCEQTREEPNLLMVGATVGGILNEAAELRDELGDVTYLDASYRRLTTAAGYLNLVWRLGTQKSDDAPSLLCIADQGTQKVLYRRRA